jgi:CRP/FNR family transcriptional regulator, cyclic AMP receptor protein
VKPVKIEKNDIVEKLARIPFFGEVGRNAGQMDVLVGIIRIKTVRKGSCIICEGDTGTEMYILYKGSVDVRKKTREGDDYTVVLLEASQNVFFGEMALIDDDKRSATVLALEDCVLLVITKEDFLKLGDSNPQICLPIMREISRKLASHLRKTTQDVLYLFDALAAEIVHQ